MGVINYVQTFFNIQCKNCDFGFEGAANREAAHELAAGHIHDEDRNGYSPNEHHEVEITGNWEGDTYWGIISTFPS